MRRISPLLLSLCLISTGCFEREPDEYERAAARRDAKERADQQARLDAIAASVAAEVERQKAIRAAIAVEDAKPRIEGFGPSTAVEPVATSTYWKPRIQNVEFYDLDVVSGTQFALAKSDDKRWTMRDGSGNWSDLEAMPERSNMINLLVIGGRPFPIFLGNGLIQHANGFEYSEALHLAPTEHPNRGVVCMDGSTMAIELGQESVGFLTFEVDGTAKLYPERVAGHLIGAVGDGWLVHVGGPYDWNYRIITRNRASSEVISANVRPRVAKRSARLTWLNTASPQRNVHRDQIVSLVVDPTKGTVLTSYDPNLDPLARIVSVDREATLWAFPPPKGPQLVVDDPALGNRPVVHVAGASIPRGTNVVGVVGDSAVNVATTTLIAAGSTGIYECPLVEPRTNTGP